MESYGIQTFTVVIAGCGQKQLQDLMFEYKLIGSITIISSSDKNEQFSVDQNGGCFTFYKMLNLQYQIDQQLDQQLEHAGSVMQWMTILTESYKKYKQYCNNIYYQGLLQQNTLLQQNPQVLIQYEDKTNSKKIKTRYYGQIKKSQHSQKLIAHEKGIMSSNYYYFQGQNQMTQQSNYQCSKYGISSSVIKQNNKQMWKLEFYKKHTRYISFLFDYKLRDKLIQCHISYSTTQAKLLNIEQFENKIKKYQKLKDCNYHSLQVKYSKRNTEYRPYQLLQLVEQDQNNKYVSNYSNLFLKHNLFNLFQHQQGYILLQNVYKWIFLYNQLIKIKQILFNQIMLLVQYIHYTVKSDKQTFDLIYKQFIRKSKTNGQQKSYFALAINGKFINDIISSQAVRFIEIF